MCNAVDFQAAIDAFQRLEKLDPYRLSSVDTYSNVLFVKVIVEVVQMTSLLVILLYRAIRLSLLCWLRGLPKLIDIDLKHYVH